MKFWLFRVGWSILYIGAGIMVGYMVATGENLWLCGILSAIWVAALTLCQAVNHQWGEIEGLEWAKKQLDEALKGINALS